MWTCRQPPVSGSCSLYVSPGPQSRICSPTDGVAVEAAAADGVAVEAAAADGVAVALGAVAGPVGPTSVVVLGRGSFFCSGGLKLMLLVSNSFICCAA